ncbi:MAG: diguanylate cyclase [Anaerolineae bacterium]
MTSNLMSNKLPGYMMRSKEFPDSRHIEFGIITVDANGRISGINPAVSEVLCMEAGAFAHRSLPELMMRVFAESDVRRTMEAIRQALADGQVSTFELQLSRGERPAAFVNMHVSPMHGHNATSPSVVLTLQDITPYKQVGLTGLAHENARRYTEALEFAARLEQQKENYRQQSIHDGLTGLYNYAHFNVLLADEIARVQRYGHPLALMMIDIDDFKVYNDVYGHPAGNLVLQDLATIFLYSCRQTDRVARYGGEEFAVILPETDAQDALAAAKRLHRAVRQGSGVELGFRRPITVSIGVAVYPPDNPQELVLRADERLYRAKAAGKNRVCGLEETLPTS